MAVTKRQKWIAVGAVFGLILLLALVGGVRFWWNYGYSHGTRTGVIRKIAIKGPPYCKYLDGEMVLQGLVTGQAPEIWEFSVDDDSPDSPLVKKLQEAEKSGERVTLAYRQDLHSLYRCTPSEYFVTAVEK